MQKLNAFFVCRNIAGNVQPLANDAGILRAELRMRKVWLLWRQTKSSLPDEKEFMTMTEFLELENQKAKTKKPGKSSPKLNGKAGKAPPSLDLTNINNNASPENSPKTSKKVKLVEPPSTTRRKSHNVAVQKFYKGYGYNWPYFSYATQFKKVLILNCFNPSFVQRYEFPANVSTIMQTFLTDTSDCFIIAETIEDTFEIYQIDLDSSDPRVNAPILKYSFDDVEGALLTGFHARGSS